MTAMTNDERVNALLEGAKHWRIKAEEARRLKRTFYEAEAQAMEEQAALNELMAVELGHIDDRKPDPMDPSLIPMSTLESLRRYKNNHIETGGFLRAVLSNDLREAIGRADHRNLPALPVIVAWLYNEMPMGAWGSPSNVTEWLKMRDFGLPDGSPVRSPSQEA